MLRYYCISIIHDSPTVQTHPGRPQVAQLFVVVIDPVIAGITNFY